LPSQSSVSAIKNRFTSAAGMSQPTDRRLLNKSLAGDLHLHIGQFGRAAYLAQSPQFSKQMAIASGIDKILEIGPVFRAKPSFTSRHPLP
jgi:aspartyl-tRNA synthetase